MIPPQPHPAHYAVIDLGSNSFKLLIAVREGEQLRPLDRLRESVRLGAGLDADGRLSAATRQRALSCLARFGQRLRGIPHEHIRAVGTNTLRHARDAASFAAAAHERLGVPIEIITGREEARLIYLGVTHTHPAPDGAQLVVDIGGGSTELIVGRGDSPVLMESIKVGCVFSTHAYFPDGEISAAGMRAAIAAAELEIQPVMHDYRAADWSEAIGASGTIKATAKLLNELGLCHGEDISHEGLRVLRHRLVDIGHIERLDFDSLGRERQKVIAGGVAVLSAVFHALKIERMQVSQGALREGVLCDLLGVHAHHDVRQRSVAALARRFSCDQRQAGRVATTAAQLLAMATHDWALDGSAASLLSSACHLHEIGLAVSHTHPQRHGAYLLTHTDLFGFSQNEQRALAALIGVQRRKPNAKTLEVPGFDSRQLARLAALLRLAVLLHRDRNEQAERPLQLHVDDDKLGLQLADGWLDQHPLTKTDLKREQRQLQQLGIHLSIND